jgi:putative redox protein
LFLAAIGGCFMSNLLAAINARKAEVSDVHTEVIATLAEAPSRFTAVELRVSAECADRELFAKLVEIAERGCIMVNTLKGKIDLQVRIDALV